MEQAGSGGDGEGDNNATELEAELLESVSARPMNSPNCEGSVDAEECEDASGDGCSLDPRDIGCKAGARGLAARAAAD